MANKIKAKRILQLHAGGMSRISIAKMRGFSEHGVADTLDAADEMGIGYPDVSDLSDEAVYQLLFPQCNLHEPAYALSDWELPVDVLPIRAAVGGLVVVAVWEYQAVDLVVWHVPNGVVGDALLLRHVEDVADALLRPVRRPRYRSAR